MDEDDNFLTHYEVWQREDNYDRECELAAQWEWEETHG